MGQNERKRERKGSTHPVRARRQRRARRASRRHPCTPPNSRTSCRRPLRLIDRNTHRKSATITSNAATPPDNHYAAPGTNTDKRLSPNLDQFSGTGHKTPRTFRTQCCGLPGDGQRNELVRPSRVRRTSGHRRPADQVRRLTGRGDGRTYRRKVWSPRKHPGAQPRCSVRRGRVHSSTPTIVRRFTSAPEHRFGIGDNVIRRGSAMAAENDAIALANARAQLAEEALLLSGSLNLRRTALGLLTLIRPRLADWAILVIPDPVTGGLELFGGNDIGFNTVIERNP